MKQPSLDQRIEAIESVVDKLCYVYRNSNLRLETLGRIVARDTLEKTLEGDEDETTEE